MKSNIIIILFFITIVLTFLFSACAGPGNVSVGVGVGVSRPYGVPPAGGSIWIGRPMPRTMYNNIPLETEIRYVHYEIVPEIESRGN